MLMTICISSLSFPLTVFLEFQLHECPCIDHWPIKFSMLCWLSIFPLPPSYSMFLLSNLHIYCSLQLLFYLIPIKFDSSCFTVSPKALNLFTSKFIISNVLFIYLKVIFKVFANFNIWVIWEAFTEN